jgi:hypothetical protein
LDSAAIVQLGCEVLELVQALVVDDAGDGQPGQLEVAEVSGGLFAEFAGLGGLEPERDLVDGCVE